MGRMIDRTCAQFADREAFVSEERRVTYRELNALLNRLGHGLRGLGLDVDDRVGVLLPNGLEWVITDFALMKAGLPHLRLHTMLKQEDFAYLINDAGARAVICTAELGAPLLDNRAAFPTVETWIVVGSGTDSVTGPVVDFDALLQAGSADPLDYSRVSPTTIANIRYTAGTTGRPKGAAFPHAARIAGIARLLAESAYSVRGPGERLHLPDRTLSVAPLTHAAATQLYWTFASGGTNIVPARSKWDPQWVGKALIEERITHMFLVPTMIYDLFHECSDTMRKGIVPLETLVYGASPMPEVLLAESHERFGDVLVQFFGLTEADGAFAILDKADHHVAPGSVGRAFMTTGVEIWDPDGNPLPAGEAGEIVGWGLQMMSEYINQPEATARTIVNGRCRTGDLGHLDERGYLYFHERLDDMIISGGFNVYPREVEDALLHIPEIGQVAVVGRPHDRWGQEVVAVIQARDDNVVLDVDRVIEAARGLLAGYKRPKEFIVVDSLPKSQAGKVLRRQVRDLVIARKGEQG